jgi:hypothetical protein
VTTDVAKARHGTRAGPAPGARAQTPSAAVRGHSVCRMHGAGSGAPVGNQNALKSRGASPLRSSERGGLRGLRTSIARGVSKTHADTRSGRPSPNDPKVNTGPHVDRLRPSTSPHQWSRKAPGQSATSKSQGSYRDREWSALHFCDSRRVAAGRRYRPGPPGIRPRRHGVPDYRPHEEP